MTRIGNCYTSRGVAAAILISAVGYTSAAASQVSLVYATYHPQGAIANVLYEEYLQELSKRSNGVITVKQKFYSGALFPPAEALKGVGQGLADVAHYCTGNHPAQLPLSSMAEMPYITDKGDAVSAAMAALYESYQPLRQEFQNANVEALIWDVSSPTIIGVKPKIDTAAGLQGLKVRAYGEIGNIVRIGGGMVPVTMGAGEILTSLQTRAIDGYTGSTLWMPLPFNWLPETGTLVDPKIGTYYTCGLAMNLNVYNALPDEVKKIIGDMRKEFPAKAASRIMEADRESVEAAKKRGVSFYVFKPEEVGAWKNKIGYDNLVEQWIQTRSQRTKANVREFFTLYRQAVEKQETAAVYRQDFPKN